MYKCSVFSIVLGMLLFSNIASAAEAPTLAAKFQTAPVKLQFETKLVSVASNFEQEVLGFFDSPADVKKLEVGFIAKKTHLISNKSALWLVLFSLFVFVMRSARESR